MPAPLPPGEVPGILVALAGSGASTSVALIHAGRLHLRRRTGVARHSLHLIPLLDELLNELGLSRNGLDAVAFAQGPGPFTAGRIVVASAQGLGLGLGLPLLPVSSLAAAAWAGGGERTAVALDAGQGEVYWGLFRRRADGVEPLGEEEVAAPGVVTVPPGRACWTGVGGGWAAHAQALAERLGAPPVAVHADIDVTADAVAALALGSWRRGEGIAPAAGVPTYLRPSYAERPTGRT